MHKAAEGKFVSQQGASFFSPSPGTPGEGRGEGDLNTRCLGDFDHQVLGTRNSGHLVLPITLTLPSPGVPGEGSCRARLIASTYLRVSPGVSKDVISLPPTASAAASRTPAPTSSAPGRTATRAALPAS